MLKLDQTLELFSIVSDHEIKNQDTQNQVKSKLTKHQTQNQAQNLKTKTHKPLPQKIEQQQHGTEKENQDCVGWVLKLKAQVNVLTSCDNFGDRLTNAESRATCAF